MTKHMMLKGSPASELEDSTVHKTLGTLSQGHQHGAFRERCSPDSLEGSCRLYVLVLLAGAL